MKLSVRILVTALLVACATLATAQNAFVGYVTYSPQDVTADVKATGEPPSTSRPARITGMA